MLQISPRETPVWACLDGKGDSLGIVQEIEIRPDKWFMHKPGSVQENVMHKIFWEFEIQMDPRFPSWRPNLVLICKKKRTCHLMSFAVKMDHRMKIKENEKRDKY